jgi:GDPmannose 4,6-dehydratase
MNKKALITGVTGQDGSYLSDLLLERGYRVYGMVRRHAVFRYDNIERAMQNSKFHLVEGDLADQVSLNRLVKEIQPDEVYSLAAQSHVGTSFSQPIFTSDITGLGVLRLLEAIRSHKPDARFYQASSSEQFGKVRETPQNELTPFYPRSPYGVSKCYAHYITVNYRESYGMFCCCGILYNHESSRRGLNFVTRKITDAVAQIKLGRMERLGLGLLDPKRDWGYAPEYCTAMHLMLQQDQPDDFVIATGETHSVEEFCKLAFESVGLDYKKHVYQDPRFVRPAEVDLLVGDSSKAKERLGWEAKIHLSELVDRMVKTDLEKYDK